MAAPSITVTLDGAFPPVQGSCAFNQEEAALTQRAKCIWQGEGRPVKPGHAASPSAVDIDAKETASCVGRHVQVAVAAESDPIEPGALCVRRQKLLV